MSEQEPADNPPAPRHTPRGTGAVSRRRMLAYGRNAAIVAGAAVALPAAVTSAARAAAPPPAAPTGASGPLAAPPVATAIPTNTLPNVVTSWTGNTFSGATEWVQDFVFNIAVAKDGTVYTVSFWDEGGNYAGIYKDGHLIGNCHGANGDAVAVNDSYVYLSVGNGLTRFGLNGAATSLTYAVGSSPAAAAASATQVVATDRAANLVKVFDAASGALLRSWSVNKPGAVAIGANGEIWVVANVTRDANDGHFWHADPAHPAQILHFSNTGAALAGTISGPSADWLPTSLAVDVHGDLLVGDNGPLRQVHTYTGLSGTPTRARSLGQAGGIGAGTPGRVTADKFFGIVGVGGDAAGNVYVAMYEFGTWLRKFTAAGAVVWQLQGSAFVDSADFDPASDGVEVYTKQNHYTVNYARQPGTDATWRGYTLDSVNYPQDARLFLPGHHHHATSPFLKRLNGQMYMYVTGMYCGHLLIYRFQGEIAKPSGAIFKAHWSGADPGDDPNWPPNQPASGQWIWRDLSGNGAFEAGEFIQPGDGSNSPGNCWVWYVDDRGDIWEGGDRDLRRYPLQGFDAQGNPVYTYASRETIALPAPFSVVRRLHYDVATDVMYMVGYTPDQVFDNAHWKECGKVLVRYDKWSTGNRTPTWTLLLPWDTAANPIVTMVSLAFAGDYIFISGIATRGQIWVWRAADASPVGTWQPGANVGGVERTGWVDVPYGITATRRSNGDYLVQVEDDLFNKVLLYRWTP
ncbi:hypothetical protein ACFZAM_21685 [Streptomyces sp. NPDC008079]|uniref:hypothetical protein n=1 Tax=Streptomyces sp. NPDC008079 TaxID=3364806 RepID=UPI0036EA75FC